MNKYIRIYCNDIKARSTGHDKWYREMIFEKMGLTTPVDYSHNNMMKVGNYLFSQIPDALLINHHTHMFYFTIEIVKAKKHDDNITKEVIERIVCPFNIIRTYHDLNFYWYIRASHEKHIQPVIFKIDY